MNFYKRAADLYSSVSKHFQNFAELYSMQLKFTYKLFLYGTKSSDLLSSFQKFWVCLGYKSSALLRKEE